MTNDLGRSETVTFLRGEDEAQLRRLRSEAERLHGIADQAETEAALATASKDADAAQKRAAAQKRKDADAAREAAESADAAADEFAAQAEERGAKVVVRSIGRKTWRTLFAQYPPREDNEDDKKFGANADEFGEAIVPKCVASITRADGSTALSDEDREDFLDGLSTAQYGQLEMVAYALNASVGADPKARLASAPAST